MFQFEPPPIFYSVTDSDQLKSQHTKYAPMDAPDTLELTNKLLHDLERKLSFVSTTSLTPLTQLHGSVVQNPNMAGLARRNIQLSVLSYIRDNGSDFDTESVYVDRQQKFMTTFNREYSPSVSSGSMERNLKEDPNLHAKKSPEISRTITLEVAPSSPAAELQSASIEDQLSELNLSQNSQDYDYQNDTYDPRQEQYASDTYDDYYDSEFDSGEDDYGDDFENEFSDFQQNESDEEQDEMLLPPLPPRLPPREMDPDKLYGLYDFSGPDPLHCTLARDEPVYLINDLDNYWWLIRKMLKQERMQLWTMRGSRDNFALDPEDGKIGFVPAECLETYAERLARLNCHKNEELEKLSRETLPLDYYKDSYADLDESQLSLDRSGSLELKMENERVAEMSANEIKSRSSERGSTSDIRGSDLHVNTASLTDTKLVAGDSSNSNIPEVTLARDGSVLGRKLSILKKSRGYKQSNKLVTFENLGDINLDDDDDSEDIDFSHHYFHVDELKPPGHDDTEKHSEVLSDVYPAEMPLKVTKSTRKLASPENLEELFARPRPLVPQAGETDLIGSFSPDTPPVGRFSSPREDFSGGMRRSQILDRLTRVTSDIQEQLGGESEQGELNFGGSLSGNETDEMDESDEDFRGEGKGDFSKNDDFATDDLTTRRNQSLSDREHSHKNGYSSRNSQELSKLPESDSDEEFHNPYDYNSGSAEDHKSESESDTPLTSMNSLNLPVSPKISNLEKRKLKPVHDMFMPILGKLDELTEKLAELEQHLL